MEQILRDQGWEPESNICRCGHLGGDHSSWGNRCLICEDDIFSSFSEKELWANAIAALEAAGVTRATPDAGGVFWDERAHEIGADPALSDFQKVNALLRLIDATLAPTPPDAPCGHVWTMEGGKTFCTRCGADDPNGVSMVYAVMPPDALREAAQAALEVLSSITMHDDDPMAANMAEDAAAALRAALAQKEADR